MPAQILLTTNPLAKKSKSRKGAARKKRTAKPMARRHLSRKQIAAGFGGKRAQASTRRRRSSRNSKPRRSSRRSYARNPIVSAAPKKRRRRSARTIGRYVRRRASRSGGLIMGVVSRDIVPAAIGGAGALALDMLWPHLTFLPEPLQTGPMVPVVRLAGALAIGVVGGMIAGRRVGTMMTIGAMVPTFYDIGKGYIAAAAPPPPPPATPAVNGYAPLGWPSPARLAGYAPLNGYAPVSDYQEVY